MPYDDPVHRREQTLLNSHNARQVWSEDDIAFMSERLEYRSKQEPGVGNDPGHQRRYDDVKTALKQQVEYRENQRTRAWMELRRAAEARLRGQQSEAKDDRTPRDPNNPWGLKNNTT